jgi:hypothetical protein
LQRGDRRQLRDRAHRLPRWRIPSAMLAGRLCIAQRANYFHRRAVANAGASGVARRTDGN